MYERDEYDQSEPSYEPQPDSPPERPDPLPLDSLKLAFQAQLLACLEECAHGRAGLFGTAIHAQPWLEAEQLRQLAMALQGLLAQQATESDSQDPVALLIDQFLDLCTMHGESNPGEARLAREFLREIASPTPPQAQPSRPW
jgi:hypothetical protein